MTAEAAEPEVSVDADLDETYADELVDEEPAGAGPAVTRNDGQVATQVQGDMVQTINNWLGRYRAAQELSDAFVRDTMATFVERVYRRLGDADGGLRKEEAAQLLVEQSCLLLAGDPDSGRRTAAVGVLSALPLPRRVIPIDDDLDRLLPVEEIAWTDTQPAAYLLTIPSAGGHHGRLPEQLMAYRQAVRQRASYLVVLLTEDALESLPPLPGFGVLSVGPPGAGDILRHQLAYESGQLDIEALIAAEPLRPILTGATPAQVVRLSARIRAAAGAVLARGTDDPVREIAAEAVKAYQNWDKQLVDWFEEFPDARTRLFLIATAFLEGDPASAVLHATEKLATDLKEPADVRGGIAAPGIRQLAKRIRARTDEERRIYFTYPAYGAAVLEYVHSDQSRAFRSRLWQWAAELPIRRRGTPSQRVANRVAAAMHAMTLSLPGPDAPDLRTLTERWWSYLTLRPLAVELITTIALSPEAGALTRQRLNQWAGNSGSVSLLSAIAAVCGGELADAYPQAALTRLNNLAGRGLPMVTGEVVGAVERLWPRPRHRRVVLQQVIDWMAGDEPHRDAGRRALAAVTAMPDQVEVLLALLAGDPRLRTALVNAFAALFTGAGPRDEIRAALLRWLDAAVEQSAHEELITDVMVRAGKTEPRASARLSLMSKLAYDWQPVAQDTVRPAASDLRDRLNERLHRADPLSASRRENALVATHG